MTRARGSAGTGGATELVTWENAAPVEARLDGIAQRMLTPQEGMKDTFRELESAESHLFSSYGGKYVRTGALRASLTGAAASGALRRLAPDGITFGSAVPYARYHPVVLKLPESVKGRLPRQVLNHILGDSHA